MKQMTLYEIIESHPKFYCGKFGSMKRRNCIYFEITHCMKGKYKIEINFKDENDEDDWDYFFETKEDALKFAKDNNWTNKKLRVTD